LSSPQQREDKVFKHSPHFLLIVALSIFMSLIRVDLE